MNGVKEQEGTVGAGNEVVFMFPSSAAGLILHEDNLDSRWLSLG